MKPILRPATKADYDAIYGQRTPFRSQAFTIEKDGQPIAVGGLQFRPDEVVLAFLDMAPGITGKLVPVTLHRGGKRIMEEVRRLGLHCVIAVADLSIPRAEAWLSRFGFKPVEISGCTVWMWRKEQN